ncbi:MAG: RDD family protein, partial [Burkholderiales bacterium]
LQVSTVAGERLSFLRSLGRNLAKIISGIPLYIGFLLAAFTSRKQALHDIIANCVIVRAGPSNFMKAVGATVGAILLTIAAGYYYVSSIYLPEMEKAMKAAQKGEPAMKPQVAQAPAPGPAFPAADKPGPAPVGAQPTAPAIEAPPTKVAAAPVVPAQVKGPAAPVKPAAADIKPAPAPAKPATAEIKPMPAKPAEAPAKPASAQPMKPEPAPAVKAKPAPRAEPVITAAAPPDEAPQAPRQPPAPRPVAPPVEVTRVPAIAAGPTPAYNDVMTAVMYRDRAGVTQLLDLGWWPDRRDSNGVTPLMAAAMNGDAAMTELLLSRGANATLSGPGGSMLDYANRGGDGKVAELLRKAGAR